MNYHNSMDRLAAIIAIMIVSSNYYPGNFVDTQVLNPSVKEISNTLGIPASVIRKDMEVLIKNPQLKPYLWCYKSSSEKEKERKNIISEAKREAAFSSGSRKEQAQETAIEEIADKSYLAKEFFDEGKFTDDTIVVMDPEGLGGLKKCKENEQYIFFTTERESVLLSYLFQQLTGNVEIVCNQDVLTDAVFIKENALSPIVRFDEKKRQEIQAAIEFNKMITFHYTDRNYHEKQKTISPRLLYHNLSNGHMYCITGNNWHSISAYRLDRMNRIEILSVDQSVSEEREQIFKQFDYLWGMDLTDIDKPPVHVKIRIDANTHNILNKIRADVDRRIHKKFYAEGSYYYYEDDIIGLNDFRSWLYQYGSSLVVLEPKELAQKVYRSAKRRLRNYQEKRFTLYDIF